MAEDRVISGTKGDEGAVGMLFPVAGQAPEMGENDREVSRHVWSMLGKAKAWRSQTPYSEAEENWGFWDGRGQWKRQRAASLSMAVLNEVFPTVEAFLGHLGDNIPDPIVKPRRVEHVKVAQMAQKLLKWSDDVNDFRQAVQLPVRSAEVACFGVWGIDWWTEADRGRGRPFYRFVDENCFFLSPWARSEEDAAYCIEAVNVPIDLVRKRWERGNEVPPGTMDGSFTPLKGSIYQDYDKSGNIFDSQSWTTSGGYTQSVPSGGANSLDRQKDLVTLISAYIRQDDGDLRHVVVCNGIVLEDGPSPYEDEEFPYVVFKVIADKSSYVGRSVVSVIKKLQMMTNEMASYMLDHQRFESDSPLVVKSANIREGRTITNAAGSIYVDNQQDGQGYYLLQKPGANPNFLQIQEFFVQKVREITGNTDVLRGEHPAGVSTLGALEILRDESNVLVKKMAEQVYGALRRKNRLVLARIKQFMKDERTLRISGRRGQEEFITVNQREGMGADGEWQRSNVIPDDFEADMDFTPQPPGGSQARFERAMALIGTPAEDGKPLVDRQWVLEAIEEDQERIDGLMERLGQAQEAEQEAAEEQAAAQAEEQAAATPGPGGVPAPVQPKADDLDREGLLQRAAQIFSGIAG